MNNEFPRVHNPTRDIDMMDVWRAIVAGKKAIIAVTLLCLAVALFYVLTASPRYSGEAKVLVENQEGYLTRQDRSDAEPDEAAVASQVQVILSRDLARQAIRKLNLSGNPEFDPAAGGGGLLRQMFGLVVGSRAATREDRIFDEYYKRVHVFALPKSRVVSIAFQSRDPALAARGANVIAELYIEMQADAKREQARAAGEALGAQVETLRTRVAEAEGKIEAFRSQTGLMVGANNTTLPSQQLGEINAQLASARTAQADAQARARLLRDAVRSGRLNEVPDVANNELMRRISEQRVTLRSQLALESRTLGPQHPRTKDLTAQIGAVDAELRGLAEKTARTLENDSRIAGSRVEFLTAAVERQMRAVSTSGDDEVRLREMEREARLIKERLDQSTQRWQEAVARESSKATPGDARVISRAVEPDKPVSPKKIVILFAAIGGLAVSVFGVVARTMIAGPKPAAGVSHEIGCETSDAIEPEVERPAAVAAPPAVEPPDVIVTAHGPDGPFADGRAIAELAARISDASHGADGEILLVIGDDSKSASEAATELGRELTPSGRAVLIDLTRRAAGARQSGGFSDILDGASSFGDALRRDTHSRLHLIHRGAGPLEFDEDMDSALVALARSYDFVVVAMAGEGDFDLALGLASFADRCVVARRPGADPESSDTLVGALEESGALAIDLVDVPEGASRRRTAGAAA